MGPKLLFVIEEGNYPLTRCYVEELNKAVDHWIKQPGLSTLTLCLPLGSKLHVKQVGVEVLKDPPEIVVRYVGGDDELGEGVVGYEAQGQGQPGGAGDGVDEGEPRCDDSRDRGAAE